MKVKLPPGFHSSALPETGADLSPFFSPEMHDLTRSPLLAVCDALNVSFTDGVAVEKVYARMRRAELLPRR